MSKNKTLKKVIAFSSALVISSSLLTGCGADPPQEQYRDSDKEDVTIVNHDSGSFSDFLAGTIVGSWLNNGTYNNRNYNEGNGSYNSRSYSSDSNLNGSTNKDSKPIEEKASSSISNKSAKNITTPNKNVSNIGTKSSISTGKTGIGSAGGRSSAS